MKKWFTVGVLMAVTAMLIFFGSRARRSVPAVNCDAHLRQIQAAKDIWALANNKSPDDVVQWSDIVRPGKTYPQRPDPPKWDDLKNRDR